jgi:hypothetical protein
MIAPLAKFIYWSVLQIGGAMLPWREAINERDLKLEQAVQFLNGPDFLPAESQPAQLDFVPDALDGRFHFPTPQLSKFAENNVVHGLMVSSAPLELWQSWEQPEIWRLPHGHISTALIASMPGLPGRVLRWLSPRLNLQPRLQPVHPALP